MKETARKDGIQKKYLVFLVISDVSMLIVYCLAIQWKSNKGIHLN